MSLNAERRVSVEGKAQVLPGDIERTGVGTPRKIEDSEGGPSYIEDSNSAYYESEDGHDIKFKTLTRKKVEADHLDLISYFRLPHCSSASTSGNLSRNHCSHVIV
jgi:hypothetical protein